MKRSLAVLRQRPATIVARRFASSQPAAPQTPMTADMKTEAGLNDERMIGDYPRVPFEYFHHRNPHLKYDDQQQKRNFNEPVYEFYDTVDVWSPDRFDQVSDNVALRNVGITIGLFAAFSALVYTFSTHDQKPAIPRDYPHQGLYKALGATEEDKEVYQARQDPKY